MKPAMLWLHNLINDFALVLKFAYGAPFVKILYLTDLAQKLLSLPEIAISARDNIIACRDSDLCHR